MSPRTQTSHAESLELPLHRSLVEPMTLAGVPRTVALWVWLTTSCLVLGLHQIWFLPVGIVVHVACAAATKHDPHIFQILPRALRMGRRRLEP